MSVPRRVSSSRLLVLKNDSAYLMRSRPPEILLLLCLAKHGVGALKHLGLDGHGVELANASFLGEDLGELVLRRGDLTRESGGDRAGGAGVMPGLGGHPAADGVHGFSGKRREGGGVSEAGERRDNRETDLAPSGGTTFIALTANGEGSGLGPFCLLQA